MSKPIRIIGGTTAAWLTVFGAPLMAQPSGTPREESTEIDRLARRIADQDARIAQLERALTALKVEADETQSPTWLVTPAFAVPEPARPDASDRKVFQLAADMRLRQELNWSDADAPDRSRSVMRSRLKAVYGPNDHVEIGARLVTGNEDDPNTTDVTIGDFANDLAVNLDQAYVTAHLGRATLSAGKFALPLTRTDLVWDGDYNPYGLAAAATMPLVGERASIGLTALYTIISEDAGGRGSDMLGAQLSVAGNFAPAYSAGLAIGYYDYRLNALNGADNGDFRSNLLTADGTYLSDYDIVDIVANFEYHGLADELPVHVTLEAVRNLGADNSIDSAWLSEVAVGTTATAGDSRISYSYMQTENDAVFAAFSHDNIPLATNYRMHQGTIEHRLTPYLSFGLVWNHFRPFDAAYAPSAQAHDWADRMRINAMFTL